MRRCFFLPCRFGYAAFGTSRGTISQNHAYVDNGTYTVSVTVTDKDGGASARIPSQPNGYVRS